MMLTALLVASMPRLQLEIVPTSEGDNALRIAHKIPLSTHELRVSLVNESERPVPIERAVTAEVITSEGEPVAFTDLRHRLEQLVPFCLAPPQGPVSPPPPMPPLEPGQTVLLVVLRVLLKSSHAGVPELRTFIADNGEAELGRGSYRIKVSLVVPEPTSRADWVAAWIEAARFGQRRSKQALEKAAHKAADLFSDHWKRAPTFWRGHLESNVVELDIP